MAKLPRQLVEEYYDVLWNEKKLESAHQFLHSNISFRGSLGMRVEGINGFCDYAKMLFGAFPNLYHVIEDVVVEGDKAAVRVVYTGTHSGKLFGFELRVTAFVIQGLRFLNLKMKRLSMHGF